MISNKLIEYGFLSNLCMLKISENWKPLNIPDIRYYIFSILAGGGQCPFQIQNHFRCCLFEKSIDTLRVPSPTGIFLYDPLGLVFRKRM